MKRQFLFSFFVLAALTSSAMPQTSSTQQTALKSNFESPKWTEADEKGLLVKAQSGDANAQMWLGSA
jgi:hypothetical protein